MANLTDPLARSVHGTNPQNLVEYITRQKIYDSLYWKEECFGLSASDVATKGAELKALGGSYGGNNKPTRFLCLALKMLQIQPEEGIVEEFLQNEDFKYVRALGAFYLRLTGRPAEIYELIEPLYNDYRKLRFRDPTGWRITHVDELADELLNSDRYCGIALPHLPKREVLVAAGYLDGPRPSALAPLIEEQAGGDAEKLLQKLADDGNAAAKAVLAERKVAKREAEEKERKLVAEREGIREESVNNAGDDRGRYGERESRRERDRERDREISERYGGGGYGDDRHYRDDDRDRGERRHRDKDERRRNKEERKKDKKYGSLFKKSSKADGDDKAGRNTAPPEGGNHAGEESQSAEYWNAERAKLGLKPLKE
ncbi:hypothetical protein ACHAXT_007160 [Thalassiosira profunda]